MNFLGVFKAEIDDKIIRSVVLSVPVNTNYSEYSMYFKLLAMTLRDL